MKEYLRERLSITEYNGKVETWFLGRRYEYRFVENTERVRNFAKDALIQHIYCEILDNMLSEGEEKFCQIDRNDRMAYEYTFYVKKALIS